MYEEHHKGRGKIIGLKNQIFYVIVHCIRKMNFGFFEKILGLKRN